MTDREWAMPYRNLKVAKAFAQRMKRPWMSDMVCVGDGGECEDHTPDLDKLCGHLTLQERLREVAFQHKGKGLEIRSFDIRPTVRKVMQTVFKEMEYDMYRPAVLPIMNLVRVAVGSPPLTECPRYSAEQRVAAKILEAFERQGIVPERTWLVRSSTGNNLFRFQCRLKKPPDYDAVAESMDAFRSIKVDRKISTCPCFTFSLDKMPKITLRSERHSYSMRHANSGSPKVWHAKQNGKVVSVKFGMEGSTLRGADTRFPTAEEALRHLHKLAQEKERKGYREIGDC